MRTYTFVTLQDRAGTERTIVVRNELQRTRSWAQSRLGQFMLIKGLGISGIVEMAADELSDARAFLGFDR